MAAHPCGPADPGRRGRPVQRSELDAHHWLGHRLTGQVLRYVAVLDGEWVALVGFGSRGAVVRSPGPLPRVEPGGAVRAAGPCRAQPAVLRAARRGAAQPRLRGARPGAAPTWRATTWR